MKNEGSVLKLTLAGQLVGYLTGFRDGRNQLVFDSEFRNDPNRPTFTLTTHPRFASSSKLMAAVWARNQRLHPVLSNLLPEGSLRELIAHSLKTHIDNEFDIFARLGLDLPGGLIATLHQTGNDSLSDRDQYSHSHSAAMNEHAIENKFSLAGVQMKFSMKEIDGRYNLTHFGELGDWIIKPPSTQYTQVPVNEFTCMTLAQSVGVSIPEIKLVDMRQINALPQINLPDEKLAYAIKRFDRDGNTRIHMEDFAQVFVKYPHEKYSAGNYEQIGRVLFQYSGDPLVDVQQLARRLLVNVLLANGDAHLKNWSLYYPDQLNPRLSPAYDIVFTQAYIPNESGFALNLAKSKAWYSITIDQFQQWSDKVGTPWRAIKPHLNDVMDRARSQWPAALKDLPMDEEHKVRLKAHWSKLQGDFRIV